MKFQEIAQKEDLKKGWFFVDGAAYSMSDMSIDDIRQCVDEEEEFAYEEDTQTDFLRVTSKTRIYYLKSNPRNRFAFTTIIN